MTSQASVAVNRYAPGHSRLVAFLKVALPLAALALLSSVFLLASPVDPEDAIRTAEIDVEERARDPRLTSARFAGVTRDGSALRIETQTARSDPQAVLRFQVTGLELHLDPPDSNPVLARADNGVIDRGAGWFWMSGPVSLQAASGYRLEGSHAEGALDRTLIVMDEPVSGTAPAGRIEAGNLRLERTPSPESRNRLVFGGGVRLIYQPQS